MSNETTGIVVDACPGQLPSKAGLLGRTQILPTQALVNRIGKWSMERMPGVYTSVCPGSTS